MKGHCTCQATGMSSHAIARRREKCMSGGNDHPHDPADLARCDDYCNELGVTTERLVAYMSGVSAAWDALLPEWDSLVTQMREEFPTGRAPIAYARMRALLNGVAQ